MNKLLDDIPLEALSWAKACRDCVQIFLMICLHLIHFSLVIWVRWQSWHNPSSGSNKNNVNKLPRFLSEIFKRTKWIEWC